MPTRSRQWHVNQNTKRIGLFYYIDTSNVLSLNVTKLDPPTKWMHRLPYNSSIAPHWLQLLNVCSERFHKVCKISTCSDLPWIEKRNSRHPVGFSVFDVFSNYSVRYLPLWTCKGEGAVNPRSKHGSHRWGVAGFHPGCSKVTRVAHSRIWWATVALVHCWTEFCVGYCMEGCRHGLHQEN